MAVRRNRYWIWFFVLVVALTAGAGSRSFMVALFDPGDGHLLHLTRRVSGTSQRVEVKVKEVKPTTTAPLTAAELADARKRWDDRKPNLADYHLEYLLRKGKEQHG